MTKKTINTSGISFGVMKALSKKSMNENDLFAFFKKHLPDLDKVRYHNMVMSLLREGKININRGLLHLTSEEDLKSCRKKAQFVDLPYDELLSSKQATSVVKSESMIPEDSFESLMETMLEVLSKMERVYRAASKASSIGRDRVFRSDGVVHILFDKRVVERDEAIGYANVGDRECTWFPKNSIVREGGLGNRVRVTVTESIALEK